jgi:hypothetical protein
MIQLKPEHPHQAGVEETEPDFDHFEGAELLANEARPRLRSAGFTDDEIDEWAHTYISTVGTGDVFSFIAWIREKEGGDDVA